MALIGLMVPPEEWLSEDLGRSLRVSVMSANGDVGDSEGSGDADGLGVGSSREDSAATAARTRFSAGVLFGFRGDDALLEGDAGSGAIVWSGSKTSEGSIFSAKVTFLALPVRGVGAAEFVIFLLDAGADDFRGLRFGGSGAGVKSSSSSRSCLTWNSSSSSDDSTTTLRRVAACLLDCLTGVSDIFLVVVVVG